MLSWRDAHRVVDRCGDDRHAGRHRIPDIRDRPPEGEGREAIADIRVLSTEIGTYQLFDGGLPLSLADVGRATFQDPYGNPYGYLNYCIEKDKKGKCKKPKKARKDRFLKPLNSDYDLYSKGQDGKSKGPLTAKASRDDIIRANDGGYIGLASEF